ncbi:MAG: methylenetetrahydrofolate--tRNA-(uracil(54)-C(5))-methyltransferase (FADH(2)-oxidizing) TrmFO [Oscillospiraceae bacterium]|jgi:methylenetetrahydrofolate--tRNA-(uracil-5-)-methyltransferase|nr:methylenetetrahydrofolate--tRNA-(uracil(54)-C(5))-methyltransferase (FADH(2)-oxidizing) TrmFO [Oscillospiraceae bacterium]
MQDVQVHVIGGGFAGVEAAVLLARGGIRVRLSEMKPLRFSPAHSSAELAELVCSNSFKAVRTESAAGLLKEEMRRLGSLCLQVAARAQVPAGGALAVDRGEFSRLITQAVEAEPNIRLCREEITRLPEEGLVIVAAGPLASEALSGSIAALCGEGLRFYDAAAPIITAESVDKSRAFTASRYDRGGEEDYLNCPLELEAYEAFWEALVSAERARTHEFDVYEGCMPIEVLAARGKDAIRYGPMKPVGLRDPATGKRPWALLQLRRENRAGSLYNLVGFQTNLKFGEQRRVFSMIPALRRAEFVRYGVMHRNTFLDAPRLLDADLQCRRRRGLYFAGQITGVEGYMESAASGLLAGRNVLRALQGKAPLRLPPTTMLGALCRYSSDKTITNFQPMGANFGLLPPLAAHIRDKRQRYEALAARAIADLNRYLSEEEER